MNKKKIGRGIYLYPLPTVIVGSMIEGKSNFNTISYCGVVQSKPPMIGISMDKKRLTWQGITESGSFSVNIPGEKQLMIVDYIGTYSGKKINKSDLFEIFFGELGNAPMIEDCPVNLECRVLKRMDFGGKNSFIVGEVIEAYCDNDCMNNGIPDLEKIKPILFTREDLKYWSTGNFLGKALEIGKKYPWGPK